MSNYTFILVHGAWHDGELWSDVAAELRARGHVVHTPTVAGHGKSADKDVSHADGVASIVRYIEEHDLDQIVLVGHSFGGTVISKVVEQLPQRVRRLVYCNAFVLEDGSSINDESPPHYREMVNSLTENGTFMLPYPVWREAFINDADEEVALSSYERLSPEPVSMLEDKLDLKRFYELIAAGELRCSYVNCTEDTAMPHGEYAWHPRFTTRLGLCRLVQLQGSHELMFLDPARFAHAIEQAGRD